MDNEGFIKLYRQMVEWEWFQDIKTCHLFLYCLLRANYKDMTWKGQTIKRGSFVTSYKHLSEATGLTQRNIRTSLKKLTKEVTHKTTSHYSIITVKNYSLYQQSDKQSDKQVTTNKNRKNITNISYINSLSHILEEEREILKNYILRQKRKPENLEAYISTLIKNGDWVEIVKKERERMERKAKLASVQIVQKEEITPATPEEVAEISERLFYSKRRG